MPNLSRIRPSNRSSFPSASQLYSIDGYQRIRKDKLPGLSWEHLFSVCNSAESFLTKKGYTDWQAIMDGKLLSLSWDWLHRFDCGVSYDFTGGLRTNILCLDDRGYDLSVTSSEALLSDVIVSLDWQHFVMGMH